MKANTKPTSAVTSTQFNVVRDLVSGIIASILVGISGSVLLASVVMLFASHA